jgi:flagellar export protein FliJ
MKPRAAWPVLVKKAKEASDKAQAEVVKAREQLKSLQASRARVQTMYDGYLQKCREAEQTLQTMAVSQSYRAFITQLQELMTRVDNDLNTARLTLQDKQYRFQAAEKKRLQMQTLMDKDLQRVREWRDKREQQAMDAAGVMLYNIKGS